MAAMGGKSKKAMSLRSLAMSSSSNSRRALTTAKTSSNRLISIFLFSLALPFNFFLGPIRLTPDRLLLCIAFVPLVYFWLSGRCGTIKSFDVLILLASLWVALSLVVNHGLTPSIEPAAIFIIETFGAFLLARYLVRDETSFEAVSRCLFRIILFLSPFAIFELFTGRPILLQLFDLVFNVFPPAGTGARWGLSRVQATFQHPILFGVFCVSTISLTVFVLNHNRASIFRFLRPLLICVMVTCSLSGGPMSTLFMQLGILAWERVTRTIKNRWTIMLSGIAVVYIAIDLLSTRTPLKVFITYLTFSARSAYNRIHIWEYGSASVMKHPMFGIGLGDWDRPSWMSSSADMFWLLPAMRYGIPVSLCFVTAVLLVIISLGRKPIRDPKLQSYRIGIVITMSGLCVAGWTVHYWNATYILFMFLLGSGCWLLDHKDTTPHNIEGAANNSPSKPRKRLADL